MQTTIFDELRKLYPDIIINEDVMDSGAAWYDLMLSCVHVTVQHTLGQGYGIYHKPDNNTFGEGPDEIVPFENLIPRLIELFKPTGTYDRC